MHARLLPRSALSVSLCSLGLVLALILAAAAPVVAAPPQAPPQQVADAEAVANRIAGIREADPDIADNFDADNGTWKLGYDGETSVYLRAGMLYIAVDVESTVAWSESSTRAEDFYMEVETTHREGALNNQFGVLFQYEDGDNFLFFSVGSDGYYSLQRLVNDEWEMVIEWTESDVIETGEGSQNLLGILSEGSTVTLLINDAIVDQVTGLQPLEGKLALAAGAYDEPGVNISFDNFAVWLLDGDSGGPRIGRPVRVPQRPEATETPEPEENPEAATPEPTATPQPEESALSDRLEAIRAEVPIYTDDFSQESAGWSPNLFDGATYGVEDGEMLIDIAIPNALGWTLSNQQLDNFYLEVDTTHLAGPVAVEHGVLFRYVDPQNFYFLAISATGEFSLWRLQENEWQVIQDWTYTPAILAESGLPNTIGLLAEGEQMTILVNDEVVLETRDDTFPTGAIGLALGTFAEGGVTVAFDNLTLWGLEVSGDSLTVPDIPAQPTAEPTEEPTEEPAGASARIEAILASDPTISDDFRRDQGLWAMDATDSATPFFERRALHIEVVSENWIGWSEYVGEGEEQLQFSDFYTEVDMSFAQRPIGAAGGMIVRLQDSGDFYYFVVEAAGNYSLHKRVGDVWVELIPWTATDQMDTADGAVTRIGALAEGDQLALTINGVTVGEVQDADLSLGYLALLSATTDTAPVEVIYDNFELWDLSQ